MQSFLHPEEKKYVSNVTWLLARCKLTDIVCLHAFQLSILFTQLNPRAKY